MQIRVLLSARRRIFRYGGVSEGAGSDKRASRFEDMGKMKTTVKNLENKDVGMIDLLDAIFALKPRRNSDARRQLAAKRARDAPRQRHQPDQRHDEKTIEPKRAPAMRARQSALAAVRKRRGNLRARSCAATEYALPREGSPDGALCMALSSKQKDGKLIVLDEAKVGIRKTRILAQKLEKWSLVSALIIDGANLDPNYAKAALQHSGDRRAAGAGGANVYDILRRDVLVLTKNAVEQRKKAEMSKTEKPKRNCCRSSTIR